MKLSLQTIILSNIENKPTENTSRFIDSALAQEISYPFFSQK